MGNHAARHMGAREGRGSRPGRRGRVVAAVALALVAAVLGVALLATRGWPVGSTGSSEAAANASQGEEAQTGSEQGEGSVASPAPSAQEGAPEASGTSSGSGASPAEDSPGGESDGASPEVGAHAQDGSGDGAGAKTAARVRAAVEPLVGGTAGTASVAYVPLSDADDACYIEADRKMRSASLIKLAVLAEYLHETDAGELSGSETYTLRASDIVGGTGSLQGRGAGSQVTFDELARLMICESDNVAANVLIDRMGMDAINAEASSLGLSSTVLARRMMDAGAMAQGRDNYTSARDVARVLDLIGTGSLVSREASAKALGWLEEQTDREGIPAGVPRGTTVGNKTGSLESARHDGAIVLGKSPYVLVVLTDGMGAGAANDLISQVSRTVWQTVE